MISREVYKSIENGGKIFEIRTLGKHDLPESVSALNFNLATLHVWGKKTTLGIIAEEAIEVRKTEDLIAHYEIDFPNWSREILDPPRALLSFSQNYSSLPSRTRETIVEVLISNLSYFNSVDLSNIGRIFYFEDQELIDTVNFTIDKTILIYSDGVISGKKQKL